MEKLTIEGLYEAAYEGYRNISFNPDKRAASTVETYEDALNEDIVSMPSSEQERYIDGFKKHLFSWLSAMSRTASTMVTGQANFPAERNRKAQQAEMKRYDEFTQWRSKALLSINRRMESAKTDEEKMSEALENWKQQVDRLFEGYLVDRFRSRLETVARAGNVLLVRSVLEYLDGQQTKKRLVIATPRHSVWRLAEVAEKHIALTESKKDADSQESEINGVRVVKNIQADRLQLFFDGKPDQDTISKLKHAAFRWSPSNGCWQRQLTQNAIWAAERLLK